MEQPVDEENTKSASLSVMNGSSESNFTNGFSSLNEEKCEPTIVKEDYENKKYAEASNTLPDAQECPPPYCQQPASVSTDMNEGVVQGEESKLSPRALSPSPATNVDKSDSDVVSLIDIEASLEHIQSNGCATDDNMPPESLNLICDEMKEMPVSLLPQEAETVCSEGPEASNAMDCTVPCKTEEADSLPSGNQNVECESEKSEKATLAGDSSSGSGNTKGLSNYAIMPGELTNQLIEGPSITLPSTELQNQSLAESRKDQSVPVSQSEIPSMQQSENIAQPSVPMSINVPPPSKPADVTSASDLIQPVVDTHQDTKPLQAVEESSEAKTSVSESSSSSSPKPITTTTAPPTPSSAIPNQGSVKQKVKKTPHDFIFGKVLGEGSYSTVHLAKEVSTQKEFAIKVCDKKHLIRERKTHFVMREKEVLMKLNHPFFIRLAYTFQDPERLYYVLTYARNGELLAYLHKLSVFDVPCTRFYSAEIVLALEYLQSLGIVHRDLKPENILFGDDMHIKITDFGTSKIIESDVKAADNKDTKRKNSFVGTAEYVSPEVLNNLPANYGSDIWALGCIIYQCLSSSSPFRCGNEYQTFQKIVKLEYEFPNGFHEGAKDLVQKLLVIDPYERLGMHQPDGMAELKKHHFFQGIDWENLPTTTPPKLLPYLPATGDNPEFWGGQELRTGFDDQRLAEIITGQSIDGTQSPEVEVLPVKGLNQMEETEKQEKMTKQRLENPFHPFVENNLILRQGFVDKRKGLFARKRMLLLTEGPHLYYVDAHNKILKGEIPWSKELRPEAKNFKIFFVHTPNRTYYLESRNPDAHLWVKQIQDVWKKYYAPDDKD